MTRRVRMSLASGAMALCMFGALTTTAVARTTHFSATTARALSSLYRVNVGRPAAHIAIIGGTNAEQGQLPYAAFVVWFDSSGNPQLACSGTVIAPNVVLTAAHCTIDDSSLAPLDPTGFRVVTRAANWSDQSIRQVSAVTQAVANPNFNPSTDAADAALLILEQPTTAPAVRLASDGERYLYTPGMPAVIAGWGIDDHGVGPTVLEWADTAVQSAGYCSEVIGLFDPSWQTCAVQAPSFESGTCSGDSGGPLVTVDANNRAVEIGVIDMGPKDCTKTDYPSFFARTNALLAWASSVVASVATAGSPPMATAPTQPVPPTLNLGTVNAYAATMVRAHTHTSPRLSVSCLRINAWKLQCSVRWRARWTTWSATGTFWNSLRGGKANWGYDVKGVTINRSCTHNRCRMITRHFRWL